MSAGRKLRLARVARFAGDESGSLMVVGAVGIVAAIGVASLAIGAIQVTNADTALRHVATLVCSRLATADAAAYGAATTRNAMAQAYAASLVGRNGLDSGTTTFEVRSDGRAEEVRASTTVRSSMLSLVGFGAIGRSYTATCKTAATSSKSGDCPEGTEISGFYNEPTPLSDPKKTWVADLISIKGDFKRRKIVGAGQPESRAFFEDAVLGDYITMRPLKGDAPSMKPCRAYPPMSVDQVTKLPDERRMHPDLAFQGGERRLDRAVQAFERSGRIHRP